MGERAVVAPDGAALIAEVRAGLAALADPVKAEPMRAYMKSDMPMLGVQATPRRKLVRAALAAHPPASFEALATVVLELWDHADAREERYAAIDLLTNSRSARLLSPAALPLLGDLIVQGAWWDLVDPLATGAVGTVLRAHPAATRPVVLGWSRDPDIWLRRTAIICQVGSKAATDLELLYACIEPSLAERDFFLRKAIGWALRQHAWTDPDEIARYLRDNADQLSPLSRREAAKNLPREEPT
jgi:3-methyladenine DNA glycosylase AlkD